MEMSGFAKHRLSERLPEANTGQRGHLNENTYGLEGERPARTSSTICWRNSGG